MPPPIHKNPNKKQTGTVPKVISSTTTASVSVTSGSTGKSSSLSSSLVTKNRQNNNINPKTSSSSSSSSHKNTEIVAPTRRELNDFNDYLLSVAESSSSPLTTSISSAAVKQHNNSGGGAGGNSITNSTNLDTTCFDFDNLNFQENQRYCYPVRPIPRQHNNKEIIDNHQSHRLTNNNSTTSNLNSAAAIGVVIPTTPNSTALDDNNYNNSNRAQFHHHHTNSSTNQAYHNLNSTGIINNTDSNSNQQNLNIIEGDLTWEQRLNFIQYFLSLNLKPNNKEKLKDKKDLNKTNAKMVNERKNHNCEIIVNSTSLEDVVQNEVNDTRAHSVTSIHTASDPNTPTYEELQSKLETSNRNIQNIKDQQAQLLRLQQAAKQNLLDMENIRNQTHNRSTPNPRRGDDNVPDYESVEQVHDDMANLVNRMKTLQTLIQGQHELSALLGEDGPDILAEQELLQRKLDELKTQKQDMKNLVSELQEISNSAERATQQKQQQQQQQQGEARVVPVEYQRVVPIELIGAVKGNTSSQQNKPIQNGHYKQQNGIHNGGLASNSDTSEELNSENNLDENPEEIAETAELIRQKMADINAMKNQLKRLKDMMETVKMIEEKTEGKSVKDIGNNNVPEEPVASVFTQRESQPKLLNRNNTSVTPPVGSNSKDDRTEEEEEMSEKVRLLHEMTQDLREQARQMSSERDRLRAIKEEIKKRRETAEKNTIRESSIQKSMSNTNSNLNNEAEKQLLEAEYEAKKKEFEKLFQRLQEEDVTEDGRIDNVQEDEERESIKQEVPSHQYNRDNWHGSNVASIPSVHSCKGGQSSETGMTPLRGKDSADSGAADINGQPSIEAGSFKSGSSRSYSVPPPMRSINNREIPWRKNSQDNASSQFNQFMVPPPPPPLVQPSSGMPSNWNPAYYYSTPYAQPQCSPHFHSGGGGGGDCCNHQCHSNSTLNVNSQQQSMTSDPMLLQQFIQTQQMLINSVSQCNQLLWSQQKEINNLNNAVILLQERLLNSTEMNPVRAESVPNHIATNTFCLQQSTSRAQSEQPQSFPQQQQSLQPPPMSPIRSYHAQSHNTFHHFRRNFTNTSQCTHNHCCGNSSTNTSFNNFAAEQQQGTTTGLCSQVPTTQPSNQNFLNNNIPPNSTEPGPIFMHHHNNTITPLAHHNISNLLNSQQNCLNSPNPNTAGSTTSQPTAVAPTVSATTGTNNMNSVPNTSSNAAAAAAALNNQVPPGNRANNYWDNFRSYSRQNLLSSNSCKSNEEQNHYYQQIMNPSSSTFGQNLSSSTATMTNQNLNGSRNLYQQQQQNCSNNINSENNTSNMNSSGGGIIANLDANKYIHTFRNQFNNINGLEHHEIQQQQPQQQNLLNTGPQNVAPNNMENFQQQQTNGATTLSTLQNLNFVENLNLDDELFNYNNGNSNNSNVASFFDNPDFRNMNFNFGMNDYQKKIPFKTPCSSGVKRMRKSSSPLGEIFLNQRMINNAGNSDLQQQQQQQINSSVAGNNRDLNQFSSSGGRINFETNNRSSFSSGSRSADEFRSLDRCEMLDNQNDFPKEMKQNELKNVLNTEKFKSKFFESICDNVCSELRSVLQRGESTNPQYLLQVFKALHNYKIRQRSLNGDNIGGGGNGGCGTESNDDDNNNELYDGGTNENERNQQQQQQQQQEQCLQQLQSLSLQQQHQQHQQQINQTVLPVRNNMTTTNNHIQFEQQISKDSNSDEYFRSENNHDNEVINNSEHYQHFRQMAHKIIRDSMAISQSMSKSSSLRLEKDKKIGLKYEKVSSSQRNSPKIPNEVYRPDYELVSFLMSNVVFDIHRLSHIDDNIIMRIAQLLSSLLYSRLLSISNNNRSLTSNLPLSTLSLPSSSSSVLSSSSLLQVDRNLFSTKELYRRMKSFETSNRDTFLSRLETYLQTLFVMKVSPNYNNSINNNHEDMRNNSNLINKKIFENNMHNMAISTKRCGGEEATGTAESDINLSINHNTENNRKISQNNNQKSNIIHNEEGATSMQINSSNEIRNSNVDSTIDGNSNNSDNNTAGRLKIGADNTVPSMFFRNSPGYRHQHHHLLPDKSSNAVVSATATAAAVTITNNNKGQISSPNTMNNSNNIMNEDLAEADQICSSNNENNCSTNSGDGNCLISIAVSSQQNDNSSLPLSSIVHQSNHNNQQKHQMSHKQQQQQQAHQFFEAAENYFNDRYHHAINGSSNYEINDDLNSEDDIHNLASNYSNFVNESQQYQQRYNHHRGNLIVDNEYESQFFKKYCDAIQSEDKVNAQNINECEKIKCDDRIENDDNRGNISIENEIESDFDETFNKNDSRCNVENNSNDNENDIDDDDDEEEDDRAQFMMTDAACALVFPINPKTTTICDSTELLPRISHSHQNSTNCMQSADSSTIDFVAVPGSRLLGGGGIGGEGISTSYINDNNVGSSGGNNSDLITTTKRNSVP